jgi:FixJ family two-component response regulator
MFQQPSEAEVTVYVVDDDQQSSRAIAELVRTFGHEVKVFDGPQAFLDALAQGSPDQFGVVILDHRMPGMDGLEVCQLLVERGVTMPVILVSGHAETSLTVRAMRSGALAVLDKPCRENELWSFIQEALAKSEDQLARRRHRQALEQRFRRLSPPDRQVLQLILEGCKNRTMAKRLDVSLRTVENRRRRVFEVMQAESVAALTRMVMEFEHGLPPLPARVERWMELPFERVA